MTILLNILYGGILNELYDAVTYFARKRHVTMQSASEYLLIKALRQEFGLNEIKNIMEMKFVRYKK